MHEDDQLTTLAGHAAVLGGHRPVAAPSRKWTRGERVRGRRRMSCVARGTRPKSVFPLPCRGGVGLGDWGSRGGPRRPSCWSALAHAYPHPHPYQHRHTHDHTHTHTHTLRAYTHTSTPIPTRPHPHPYPHPTHMCDSSYLLGLDDRELCHHRDITAPIRLLGLVLASGKACAGRARVNQTQHRITGTNQCTVNPGFTKRMATK